MYCSAAIGPLPYPIFNDRYSKIQEEESIYSESRVLALLGLFVPFCPFLSPATEVDGADGPCLEFEFR